LSTRTLEVWCFDELAGVLADAADGLTFAYAPDWFAAGRPPLSQSLPLDGAFAPAAAGAFFGGLLPEGAPRELLARELGVSSDNDFSLLAALAGDTAGAITLVVPGEGPPTSHAPGDDVTWLDDAKLAAEIERLPTRPMHVDADGEYRLSLAGAQDKLPVVVGADGRVGLTKGWTPSTHILKTPIANLENTVANEAMCLDLGRRLGIPVAVAVPRRAGDRECLLVTRYDREGDEHGGTRRLHQEDFCQALGIPAARKYQAEGGPTLPDCFALLRRASSVPAADAVHLLDQVTLSFLVGNHDAHAKNYSLLYRPELTELAPAYDILSTFPYRGALRLSRKLAMSIGSEYRPDYLRERHLAEMLAACGLGPAATRRRIDSLALAAPEHAQAARDVLAAGGWDAPVLGRIVELVTQRSRWLHDATRRARAGT
jgi:serine/threonine-protein kinase HipA